MSGRTAWRRSEREHRSGAVARAGFGNRERGKEIERKGCQRLLALQEAVKREGKRRGGRCKGRSRKNGRCCG